MTPNAMRGDREECIATGMDDYVAKPITPDALAKVLEKWLPCDTGNANINKSTVCNSIFDYDGIDGKTDE
jgi:DNA-binding response OmpR family regulator